MHPDRDQKIGERIKEIAAVVIERESNKTALITITRVEVYDRGQKALIYISVMPENGEDSAINFLKRKRKDIRDAIKTHMNIRTIPFLDVAIDTGQKALHTIEALLKEGE